MVRKNSSQTRYGFSFPAARRALNEGHLLINHTINCLLLRLVKPVISPLLQVEHSIAGDFCQKGVVDELIDVSLNLMRIL